MNDMTDEEYRALLGLMMCSDPWPASVNRAVVEEFLDRNARDRGFDNWIVALHEF